MSEGSRTGVRGNTRRTRAWGDVLWVQEARGLEERVWKMGKGDGSGSSMCSKAPETRSSEEVCPVGPGMMVVRTRSSKSSGVHNSSCAAPASHLTTHTSQLAPDSLHHTVMFALEAPPAVHTLSRRASAGGRDSA